MMKIVIASGIYPPAIGGMATFVQRFAELLHQSGAEVAVVAYGEKTENHMTPYLVRIVSRKGPAFVRYWRYFCAIFGLRRQADILYAQDLVSSGLPTALASLVLRKKLVLRLGGDFLWEKMVEEGRTKAPFWDYYQQPKGLRESCYLRIYRFVLNRSKLVIFNNPRQAELYRKVFAKQLREFKVVTNPWPEATTAKTMDRKQGNLVYVGRFIRLKNLDLLLRAYKQVATSRKLLLVGEGPQEAHLRTLVQSLNLQDKVQFLQPLPPEQILVLFSGSYLLIVPSLTELNPNAILEALSAGLPVLLTKENGLPESLNQKLAIFNPRSEEEFAQKLRWLLEEPNYEIYLKTVQNLQLTQTWERVVQQHLQIFKSLL